ncbi:MAG: hypothetical protein FWC32_09515 [Firmicutes bacterium]|nr:hypothetical protein [Bacillota bacterium]
MTVGFRPLAFDVYRLQAGSVNVFLPMLPLRATTFTITNAPADFSPVGSLVLVLFVAVVGGLIAIGAMLYLRMIFKQLRSGVSPFSTAMVRRFFYVVIFFTVNALISNPSFATIMLAGFMWLMYYVFDHGRELQQESDTTL